MCKLMRIKWIRRNSKFGRAVPFFFSVGGVCEVRNCLSVFIVNGNGPGSSILGVRNTMCLSLRGLCGMY